MRLRTLHPLFSGLGRPRIFCAVNLERDDDRAVTASLFTNCAYQERDHPSRLGLTRCRRGLVVQSTVSVRFAFGLREQPNRVRCVGHFRAANGLALRGVVARFPSPPCSTPRGGIAFADHRRVLKRLVMT